MPQTNSELNTNSEAIEEIITAVPKWIIRWGTTIVFAVLIAIVIGSAVIEYPDILRVNVRINSLNSPKPVLARQSGKLFEILVKDGQMVNLNESLAYFESTADYKDILQLISYLKESRELLQTGKEHLLPTPPPLLELGEIQESYRSFNGEYNRFKSTFSNGYYNIQVAHLEEDLANIQKLKSQILKLKQIQTEEYRNIEKDYLAHKQLYERKVISRSEFIQQENRLLSAKYPLNAAESSIISNIKDYNAKKQELLEIKNRVREQRLDFLQSLNNCLNDGETWIQKYVLRSPVSGKVSYAGFIQQNQNINVNDEVFIVNPGDSSFFGEVHIPQYNMGKVKIGERTLIKLKSYPFEQFGLITGKLTYISDVAYRDSIFIAKISLEKFENKDPQRRIVLKNGMQGQAEIVTEESTLLQRLLRSVTKLLSR